MQTVLIIARQDTVWKRKGEALVIQTSQTSQGNRFNGVGAFVVLLAATFAAGGIGAVASVSAPQFYQALARPTWAPPPSVFGPVWTVLYVLITAAAFVVVRTAGWRAARIPLLLYALQLLVNALWTWLFFAWHSGIGAFLDIIVLLVLIVATMWSFWRVRQAAGLLFLPYLAWVCFATLLTWSVWRLNLGVL